MVAGPVMTRPVTIIVVVIAMIAAVIPPMIIAAVMPMRRRYNRCYDWRSVMPKTAMIAAPAKQIAPTEQITAAEQPARFSTRRAVSAFTKKARRPAPHTHHSHNTIPTETPPIFA
jgi:hypothetical protein